LVTIIIYDKKNEKIKNNSLIEIDSIELESFNNSSHSHEFSKIPSSKIKNKTALKWFELNNESMWWLVSPVIYPKYNEAALFVDRIGNLISKYNPEKIILKGLLDKKKLLQQICKKNKIIFKLEFDIKYTIQNYFKNKSKKLRFKKYTKNKHKTRLSCYDGNFSLPKQNYILINAHQSYRRTVVDEKKSNIRSEFLIQPILDHYEKNSILCFDLDYTLKGITGILKERLETEFPWAPIEVLLQKPFSRKTKSQLIFLEKNVLKMTEFIQDEPFIYEGISLWPYVKSMFEEIFYEPYLPTFLHLIDKIEEFFTSNPPKLLVQVYETGPYAKCFEFVAKRKRIKTVGIMHGIIYNGHPDYMHKEILQNNFSLGNPIPDKMLVYGEYFKKILTEKGNYPTKNISIITNPTFLNIDKFLELNSKENLLEKFQLPNVKIILFPLTFRFDISVENKEKLLLDMIYEKSKKQKDLLILVRLRPGDTTTQSKLNDFYPSSNFLISKGSLSEDILCSDIVITTYSSVGVDSTFFEKPVIFVNVSQTNPFSEIQKLMVEHDEAILCDMENLMQIISTIDKGILWKINESEKRKQFMEMMFNYKNRISVIDIIKQF
jgi:hypothetical protein